MAQDRTQDEYEDPIERFDRGGSDLDGLCILVDLHRLCCRALATARGVEVPEWRDSPEYEQWWDSPEYEDGAAVRDALISAGFLRREDFVYDETIQRAVRVT